SRAGGPPPIHVPRDGEPKLCQIDGILLGVVDAPFTTHSVGLRRGDRVLFHSDGLDSPASETAVPTRELLLRLVARYSALPLQEFVDQIVDEFLVQSSQSDDITLLALELGD